MMRWNGLDKDGFIEREGGLERVQQAFAPVVAAARIAIPAAFTRDRLHSAYLYGSVPRGTAGPGTSDLDLLLALTGEPADADRAAAWRASWTLGFPRSAGRESSFTARRRCSATLNGMTLAGSSRACARR
jgi:hypothetical protein